MKRAVDTDKWQIWKNAQNACFLFLFLGASMAKIAPIFNQELNWLIFFCVWFFYKLETKISSEGISDSLFYEESLSLMKM